MTIHAAGWDSYVDSACAILARHDTVGAALRELRAVLGVNLSDNALRKAFQARQLGSPRRWLRGGSAHVTDRTHHGMGASGDPEPVTDRDNTSAVTPKCRQSYESVSSTESTAEAGRIVTPEPRDALDEHLGRKRETLLRSERQALLDRLADAEARNRFAERLSTPLREPPRVTPRETRSGLREGMAVALASDWHVEEIVNPESVAGRNEYSLAIAQRRAERFFDGVAWLVQFNRAAFAVRDLCLWLGGDLMTGYIHPELEESNELSPVESVLCLRGWLKRGIRQLLTDRQLERIIIPCNYGNHGRTGVKKRIKTGAENSFEWMLYHTLADDFATEPRVTFEIPRSAHAYVDAYDKVLHFHHGDEVRYWGGVGGLSIPLNKRLPRWDSVRRSDYHHVGHFHEFIDLGHTLVNGSLIGYTEFAMSIGAECRDPAQAFYILDARRGKCQVSPIWVEST